MKLKIRLTLLATLILALGCDWTPEEYQQSFREKINKHVTCAWHREYQLCFCGNWVGGNVGLLTEVSGKSERTCGERHGQ